VGGHPTYAAKNWVNCPRNAFAVVALGVERLVWRSVVIVAD